ncbi:MAG: penicillin-binding protein, partial [Deltaproteobacteria bacterium]
MGEREGRRTDKKWRRYLKRALLGILLAALVVVIGTVGLFLYFYYTLPPMKDISDYNPPLMTRVYSADGQIIGEFYQERRILVSNDKIPRLLRQAFVAAEDADFYRHRGISWLGIFRALIRNLQAGRIVQGGSTITQQVVRSLLLNRQRTLSRKIKELILAHRIEQRLSKDEILYIYLNQIYLGHGNYGVGAAAEDYFGKSVEELNLAEMAMLAGLPKAPELYSPLRNFDRAKRRQAYVLKRMVEEGYITEKEARDAYATPLHIKGRGNRFLEVAPYFVEYVRQYLIERYGEDEVYTGGLQVYTSLDTRMQRAAQEAVRKGLLAL